MKKESKKIKSLKLVLVFSFALLTAHFLLPATPALAHTDQNTFWTPGEPIVPCGGLTAPLDQGGVEQPECDKCQLLHLIRHLIDFVLIFVTPVVGTLFFIVAGVMIMLGGDNPGMLSRGKSIFKNTFIGVAIMLMSWLITNTLIQTLANTAYVGEGGNWWTFSCSPTLIP